MPSHPVKLVGRAQVAEGTFAFHLEKPPGFTFKAGQAVVLELLDPPAQDGQKRRTFSIASAPHESGLMIATRMRDSAFKRALQALPDGAPIKLAGPIGRFTLAGDRPGVFIAGGIGITPFLSMLRQAAHERSPERLALVYSNRRPEDAAFLEELQQLEERNEKFRMLATMTDMGGSSLKWNGPTELLNAQLVQRAAAGFVAPVYYVVGPPGMVLAVQETLRGAGVVDEDIRSEEFYGY